MSQNPRVERSPDELSKQAGRLSVSPNGSMSPCDGHDELDLHKEPHGDSGGAGSGRNSTTLVSLEHDSPFDMYLARIVGRPAGSVARCVLDH